MIEPSNPFTEDIRKTRSGESIGRSSTVLEGWVPGAFIAHEADLDVVRLDFKVSTGISTKEWAFQKRSVEVS
jgi:hypothetical protein